MNMLQPTFTNLSDLTSTLQAYCDAGIDPAFDTTMDDLEREFAELRFNCNH